MPPPTYLASQYTGRRIFWLPALLLALATLFAYQPAWFGEAVFDDTDHLTSPEFAGARGLLRIWTEPGAVSQYYPVTHTAFWLQNLLWGHAMPGYHFVNLALHLACALLFFKILQRLALPGAWLAAALFALHPVHVESVAWISEQKNTLSTALYLGAALAWLNFDESRRRSAYVAALGLFAAALLSKSVTASLPAALLLVLWWQRGRLILHRDVLPLLPFFLLGIVSGLFTAWVERRFIGATGTDFDLGFAERFAIAGKVFWFYLGKLAWPSGLAFIYPRWEPGAFSAWQQLFSAAAALLVAVLWILRRSARGPLVVVLLFAGTLFPVLGFLNVYPFRYSFVADHYVYLASLGLIAALAAVLARFSSRWLALNPVLPRAAAFALLAIFFALTWRQSRIYRNAATLWTDTLAKNPTCFVAHNNLGLHLLQLGLLDAALPHLEQARALRPAFAETHNNLANALREKGRLNEARALYEQALQIRPDLAQAHYNLGTLLLQQKLNPLDALAHFQKAVELRPEYVDARINLAGLLLDQGRAEEALPHAIRALELRPENSDALTNLGSALLALDRDAEALPHLEKAAALQPESAPAAFNLAQALLSLNRTADAEAQLERTLALKPDFARAHTAYGHLLLAQNRHALAALHYQSAIAKDPADLDATCNLAWLLATAADAPVRNGPLALELASRVNVRFSGKNPLILQILAAAQAENGRYEEAAETARQAIELSGQSDFAAKVSLQLAAYEAGEPWRLSP